jgi:cellulose synthase/poly-beta-1,6-N-acetylglucosamine synthase-like glycosyltransferase
MPKQANEKGGQTAPFDIPPDHSIRPKIRGIVVAIPARNEAASIGLTLSSILCSLQDLPASVPTIVCVACDSCIDGTVAEVRLVNDTEATVVIVEGVWQSVGGARRAAVQAGLDALLETGLSVEQVWITTTDADTTVGPDWLCRQLRYAELGLDAVAGVVSLRRDADLTLVTEEIFRDMYKVAMHGHSHVHGANLGVRADAYVVAGGFPLLSASEDRELWNSLVASGYHCHASNRLRVSTSARLHGRVEEGFAFALRKRQGDVEELSLELSRP